MNSEDVINILKDNGASLVGIADITVLKKTFGFSKRELKKYPRAISIAVQLSDPIRNHLASVW